ncbi:MAG: ferritin-like domain-containing protein [Actinomycetota bacterium]
MNGFIQPRNLTARAAHQVVGNPTSTRMESGVANCFPGLEWDIRELDRRFFPGLVFQFVQTPLYPVPGILPAQQGAKLAWLDSLEDPALPFTSDEPWVRDLLATLEQNIGQINHLSQGRWYLDSFEQYGTTFVMADEHGTPYEGEMVWRMIRGIQPNEPLTIRIQQRSDAGTGEPIGDKVTLKGFRRQFLDPDGVVDHSFKAGELTMSMCNPWSHDFRDCACHYWASNHPDVVLGPAEATLDDGQPADPTDAAVKLDWIRRDRSPGGRVASAATITENRPFQIDHYEMNARWEELPFVLEGREIGAVYSPPERAQAVGATLEALQTRLRTELAPLEFTLALQYLYAMFSVRTPAEVDAERWPDLPGDVAAIRQFVMLVAVSEMQHLRWANRLLWELDQHLDPNAVYQPVLHHTSTLWKGEAAELAPLTPETVQRFVEIERPGGQIDTAYAQAVSTLKARPDLGHLYDLAIRIDTDGNEHYSRFSDIGRILAAYPSGVDAPYLRSVELGTAETAAAALTPFHTLVERLTDAYKLEASGDEAPAQRKIDEARTAMLDVQSAADDLAARGIGVPFWTD